MVFDNCSRFKAYYYGFEFTIHFTIRKPVKFCISPYLLVPHSSGHILSIVITMPIRIHAPAASACPTKISRNNPNRINKYGYNYLIVLYFVGKYVKMTYTLKRVPLRHRIGLLR